MGDELRERLNEIVEACAFKSTPEIAGTARVRQAIYRLKTGSSPIPRAVSEAIRGYQQTPSEDRDGARTKLAHDLCQTDSTAVPVTPVERKDHQVPQTKPSTAATK